MERLVSQAANGLVGIDNRLRYRPDSDGYVFIAGRAALEIGQVVRVTFEPRGPEVAVPQFQPEVRKWLDRTQKMARLWFATEDIGFRSEAHRRIPETDRTCR